MNISLMLSILCKTWTWLLLPSKISMLIASFSKAEDDLSVCGQTWHMPSLNSSWSKTDNGYYWSKSRKVESRNTNPQDTVDRAVNALEIIAECTACTDGISTMGMICNILQLPSTLATGQWPVFSLRIIAIREMGQGNGAWSLVLTVLATWSTKVAGIFCESFPCEIEVRDVNLCYVVPKSYRICKHCISHFYCSIGFMAQNTCVLHHLCME